MKKHILAFCLVAATALPAFAQTAPAPDAGRDPRRQMNERMCRDVDARLAARIAFTEVKVNPTDAQRGAWSEFATAARAAAAPLKQLCAAQPTPAAGDLAAQLAARESWMAAMLDSTRQMRVAAEKLQPALSDEQKTALAENMRAGGGRGRGHHGHRGPHRG